MAMSDDNSKYKVQHDPLGQNPGSDDFQRPQDSEYSPNYNFEQPSGLMGQGDNYLQDSPGESDHRQSPLAQPSQQSRPSITSDYLAAQQQALANQLAMQGNSSYQEPKISDNYGAAAQNTRVFDELTREPSLAQSLDAYDSSLFGRQRHDDRQTLNQDTYHQSGPRPPAGGYGQTDHVAGYLPERQSPETSLTRQARSYNAEPSFGGNNGHLYASPTETESDIFGSVKEQLHHRQADYLAVPNRDSFAESSGAVGYQHNSLEPSYDEASYQDSSYGNSSYFEEEQPVDASYYEGDNTLENYQSRAPRGRRRLFAGSITASILVIGGGAVYAYTNGMLELPFTAETSGDTPIIRASNQPVKEKPESPGGRQFANKNKLIYDRIQGKSSEKQDERLVSRQENVLETTRSSAGIVIAGSESMEQKSAIGDLRGTLNNSVEQASARTASISTTSSNSQQVPRKVRTLIVRPDGTVLKPADSTASVLSSVDQPKSAIGSASKTTKNGGGSLTENTKTAVSSSVPTRKPATDNEVSLDRENSAVLGKKVAALSPRVTNQLSQAVAKPAPKPVQASSNSKYAIQVASSKSQTDALATFANLQQKYVSILGDYRPLIERVNLGAKGIWYRLRIGPVTRKADASQLCLKLKNSGLKSGCIIRKI